MTTQLLTSQLVIKPRTISCYADQVNNQFHKSQSHYVDLSERLKDHLSDSDKKYLLDDSITNFKLKHSNVHHWSNISLCRAQSTTLDKIMIDVTLQRMLDFKHAIQILDRFRQILVMPICVYEEPACPGKYVCWDGQHTAIVLLMIAKHILGETDLSNVRIPIVIYPSTMKSDMRQCFITLNGEGKKPLDVIDKYHQKVFGVRTDNSTNSDWILNEKKQQALENAKMFATHSKFGDVNMPGALTRLEELVDADYDLEVTENFCKYFVSICKSSRPVQPKESWLLYDFFQLCQSARITVDDQYIKGITDSIKKAFGGNDLDAIALVQRAKRSYQEWWRVNKPNPDGTLWGINYPSEKKMAQVFFLAQLRKNFTGPLPAFKNSPWVVSPTDLL